MHFAVAGAGYLGSRVLAALPVGSATAITRSEIDLPGVRLVLTDFDRIDAEPLRMDAPFRLLYTAPPPATGDDDPRLERLLSRLDPVPDRLVYISTTGVYGDRRQTVVSEEDSLMPATDRARRRVAAEASAGRWCDRNNVRLFVLRVPGIYGPGRLGLDRLSGGSEVLRDEDAGPGNRIHIDDLVACCLAALDGEAPAGIYNVGDGDHRSASAFSREVARQAGLPAPTEISIIEARKRWSPVRLSFAEESRRVDTSRMRDSLGVRPRYANPAEGIRASLHG